MKAMLGARTLTDLWILTPDWLFFRLVARFKLEPGLSWIFEDDEAA